MAPRKAGGRQCCGPVGGVGRIRRTEMQSPSCPGEFAFSLAGHTDGGRGQLRPSLEG